MPIKPINYQVMLPKASEVAKLHSDEQQKSHFAQQHQSAAVQNNAEKNINQVHSRDNAAKAMIREKREKEQNQGNKDKRKKNKDSKKNGADNETKANSIDIRL